jgi:hypothetical protein
VLGGEFRLMILIIGRAVGETLDRDQGLMNSIKRLEAAAGRTVCGLQK